MSAMRIVVNIFVVAMLLLSGIIAQETNYNDEGKYVIKNELKQDKWGQCPIPRICLVAKGPCGSESGGVVSVNCSNVNIYKYIPSFTEYVIGARKWSLDFSHNSIGVLDSGSFFTSNLVTMNLTSLDLSHNAIYSIRVKTFRGNISKDLTTLDLSHNKLEKIDEGVFDEMPSLKILKIAYNLLMNMDSLCRVPFAKLTTMELQYNRISYVSKDCLSKSTLSVQLNLNNNFLGSINDCSFSNKAVASVKDNPVLCGCSSKHTTPCLQIDQTSNTTSRREQTGCSSQDCNNVTFSLSYAPIDFKKYKISVEPRVPSSLRVDLVEYTGLGGEPSKVSAKLLQTASNLKTKFTSKSELEYLKNYTICATPLADSGFKQRKCIFLEPTYPTSSSLRLQISSLMLTAFYFITRYF